LGETVQILKNIEVELKLIRHRLEAIEEALSEEMSANDKEGLKQALKEHEKGETISLEEAVRRLTWKPKCSPA